MKDSYIAHVLEEYVADGNFEAVFGDQWIDDAQLIALIPLVCDSAFAEYGIDAKGKYANEVSAIFEGLKASNAIVRHGDDYSDYWYKLRPPYKKKYLDELRGKNPATKLVASLGEEPLRRALNKIVAEDDLGSMQDKWVEGSESEGPDNESVNPSVIVEDEVTAELLPASDRLVPLDHNSATYREVKEGLAELHEELRSANALDCLPEERERLLASLSAAQTLWEAAQLKVIQIKVGIIITIEDTIELLSKAGKAVGKAALLDIVKAIVKHTTGIHL